MADEDEVLPDDETVDGTEGEGTEGQDPTGGDQGGEVPAVSSDAQSEGHDGPPDGQQEVDRPLTRGGNRVRAAIEERNALREELAQMRRDREADRQRQAVQEQQWTEQQWQERWAVMTPEEKVNELYQRGSQQLQNMQAQMGMQMQLMRDQTSYEAKAAVNSVYARYKDEVEQQYQGFAQQGRFIPRETILKQLLGERALASAGKATGQARRQGQKKIEAQTTRPSSSKGDAVSTRGKQGDSPEKRLAGVEI